jgi:hypothetical protein
MLAAYAAAVKAAGYAVTSDSDRGELIITPAPARRAA